MYPSIGQLLVNERVALQQIQTSLVDVERELDLLHTRMADLEHQKEALKARATAAKGVCSDLVARFLREFFNNAPNDVLLIIFEAVIETHDYWSVGNMEYDRARAAAPFHLAAVCKRWRRLAVSTSTLWTYFGLPTLGNIKGHLHRVRLLAQRSQQAPVDVVARWSDAHQVDAKIVSRSVVIASTIASLAERMRRVEWHSGVPAQNVALDELQGPTPLLTHLSVKPAPSNERVIVDGYLPFAPRLQHLNWARENYGWNFSAPCYTSLAVLNLWSSPPLRCVTDLLRIVRGGLRELRLATTLSGTSPSDPIPHLEFPQLRILSLWDWSWASYLQTPTLEQLAISKSSTTVGGPSNYPSDILCPFSTTTHLMLYDQKYSAADLEPFARLNNVTKLTIGLPDWIEESFQGGQLSETFFADALACDSPLWPRLKHLRVESELMDDLPVNTGDLLAFLRTRIVQAATNNMDNAVARIDTVELEYYDAPKWLGREVKRIIASEPLQA